MSRSEEIAGRVFPTQPAHAFYAARVADFLTQSPESVVGTLATRAALEFRGNEPQQARAWSDEVGLLQTTFTQMPEAANWSLLLEYSLRRLGRRPDAVILAPGAVIVIEFKMGAQRTNAAAIKQVEDYALCLRDFHAVAQQYPIVPIVCAQSATTAELFTLSIVDGVTNALSSSAGHLPAALRLAASSANSVSQVLTWQEFDSAAYNPTPTIVEAARAIYRGHSVAEIGRSDADGVALRHTTERLRYWTLEAQRRDEHVICLVTGTPGSGKTLLGLELILRDGVGRVAGEAAVMLTGNRPLVEVLKGALSADAKARGKARDSNRALDGALQTLFGYLRQHEDEQATAPPERVVVFDEAQRAWDAKTGKTALKRRGSEPELFLEILRRLPWTCLVCLVGAGQEINRGEGGMALWEAALAREAAASHRWRIVSASPSTLSGTRSNEVDPALHLSSHIRAHRNPLYVQWVDALLSGQIRDAAEIVTQIEHKRPPAFLTRSLAELKEWLSLRRRGGRRPGLLVSSGATRIVAEGLPLPPTSRDVDTIANWFLKSLPDDHRGSDSLETTLSEFGCQGLDLDYVGLCWGGDLIWTGPLGRWLPREMWGSRWRSISSRGTAQFRLNSYRVLLTRAREGICIYVPKGNPDDATRLNTEFDRVAEILLEAGCAPVES